MVTLVPTPLWTIIFVCIWELQKLSAGSKKKSAEAVLKWIFTHKLGIRFLSNSEVSNCVNRERRESKLFWTSLSSLTWNGGELMNGKREIYPLLNSAGNFTPGFIQWKAQRQLVWRTEDTARVCGSYFRERRKTPGSIGLKTVNLVWIFVNHTFGMHSFPMESYIIFLGWQ